MRPELFWEEELDDFEGDPWQIAKSVGVRVLSDKDFRAGFQVDGEVVAVLFDASTEDEYSFDIAVLPEYRNKGLGRKLVELALDQYEEQREYRGEDFHLSLDVISPVMEALLKRYGFVEVGREGGHTIMEKRGTWKRRWKPGQRQRRQRGQSRTKSRQYYRKNRAKILRQQKIRRSKGSWKNNPARRRSEKLRRRQNRRRTASSEVVAQAWVEARFAPPRQRGGENGRNQRDQKPQDKRKDQKYYRKHRTRILRENKLHYRRKCKINSNCMARKEQYNKNPDKYKRRSPRYASVLTIPEIAFVIGREMTPGVVNSVSPLTGTVTFRLMASNVSQLNSLPVGVFLNAVTFLSDEDTQACLDLIDVEIGLEAYEDLDERSLRMCAGLYDVDPDSEEFRSKCRDLVGVEDLSSMSVSDLDTVNQELVVGVLEGGGVPRSREDAEEHDEEIPEKYSPSLFYGEVEIQKTASRGITKYTALNMLPQRVEGLAPGTQKILKKQGQEWLVSYLTTSGDEKRVLVGGYETPDGQVLLSVRLPRPPVNAASGGDCYEANGRYFLNNLGNKNLRLVHGEVTGQGGLAGVNYGHAWLEDGDTVIDVSNGRNLRLPKIVYYALGGIDRNDNYHVYDASKFSQRLTKHEHWGPWDLKTSTGL